MLTLSLQFAFGRVPVVLLRARQAPIFTPNLESSAGYFFVASGSGGSGHRRIWLLFLPWTPRSPHRGGRSARLPHKEKAELPQSNRCRRHCDACEAGLSSATSTHGEEKKQRGGRRTSRAFMKAY